MDKLIVRMGGLYAYLQAKELDKIKTKQKNDQKYDSNLDRVRFYSFACWILSFFSTKQSCSFMVLLTDHIQHTTSLSILNTL